MAGQTNHADVVGEVLAAELGTESQLVGFFEQLLLQFHIAESTSGLVAGGGQIVIVVCGSEFHREQVLLGRSTADDEGDVIGRTGGGAEGLHLRHEEGNERSGILDACLGLLIEVGLVGRTATFHHAEETVFVALGGLEVNLGGQVAAGVHLVVHVEGSVL